MTDPGHDPDPEALAGAPIPDPWDQPDDQPQPDKEDD